MPTLSSAPPSPLRFPLPGHMEQHHHLQRYMPFPRFCPACSVNRSRGGHCGNHSPRPLGWDSEASALREAPVLPGCIYTPPHNPHTSPLQHTSSSQTLMHASVTWGRPNADSEAPLPRPCITRRGPGICLGTNSPRWI